MTGTERAAMRLALGVLRRSVGRVSARDALRGADIITRTHSCSRGLGAAWDAVSHDRETPRLVRGRLALYLRALLRADAGDCGPVRCGLCWQQRREPIGRYEWHRITPLWERARAAT